MVVKFENEYSEKLFTSDPLNGKPKFIDKVIKKLKKTILILKNVESSDELLKFRGLYFEALIGKMKGLLSVSVDYEYRCKSRKHGPCPAGYHYKIIFVYLSRD
jgi:plasmid maintenance system killer protein